MGDLMSAVVCESFDDAKVLDLRLLHEAAVRGGVWQGGAGTLKVLLWSDETVQRLTGKPPKFGYDEREYFVASMRMVGEVVRADFDGAAPKELAGSSWSYRSDSPWAAERAKWAASAGVRAIALSPEAELAGFPAEKLTPSEQMWESPAVQISGRKKVVVTGCYDYFHSGHVRFFEECSELGNLFVCVGHDANVRMLKGPRNPLFPDVERRYVVGCCRFVTQALVTTGHGWMDASPEFARIRPHIYAVNEDGDKPDKAKWCAENGVEYKVLKRLPRPGLPRRTSTDMRGF